MTPAPQCCSGETLLNEVANLMVEADCGEIPVVDGSNRLIGVVTDRDIVVPRGCQGKEPVRCDRRRMHDRAGRRASPKTRPSLTVIAVMEENQIRRVPVVDATGCCCGIISQADVAHVRPTRARPARW